MPMNFSESIKNNNFLVTTELESCCPDDVFDAIKCANSFVGLVNAIVVSDELQSHFKISSVAVSHLLKDSGIDPIIHLSCKGKNKKLIETFILTSWMMGIKNLCITSETIFDRKVKTEVSNPTEVTALQLIHLIHRLRKGKDFSNKKIKEKPNFTIGTFLDLSKNDIESYHETIRQKIKAGIEFIITTPLHSPSQIENLTKNIEESGVKIIAGILPTLSVEAAREVNRTNHKKPIAIETIERLEKAKNPEFEGIHIAAELIKQIKNKVSGIHLIASKKFIPKISKLSNTNYTPSMTILKEEKDIQKLSHIFEGKLSLKDLEKAYIIRVLKNNRGNRCTTAEVLGIHRNTLMRKCQEYNINT